MRHPARYIGAFALAGAMLARAPAPALAQSAAIDTAAMNALSRMGNYLMTLRNFQVNAQVTTEKVLENGEKVQEQNEVDLVASRPNRLRLTLEGDRQQRLLLYDGSTFTVFAPRQKYYASESAPGTIAELADVLEDRFDLELPMVDLFRWGTPEAQTAAITSAKVIGPSPVDGITCMHYAFRQAGLDWQVWIQSGDYPLPRRVVLTTTTDDARPQHQSNYTWNLAPSFNDAAFAFVPPPDAKRITFAQAQAARRANPEGGN